MWLNFFRISLMNIRKNKNIFFNSIFLILFFLMIIITLSLQKTISNYIANDNANNIYHRIYLVWSETESLEEVYDKLKNINEINQISHTYEFSWSGKDTELEKNGFDGSISIMGVISDNLPDIVDGNLDDYENKDDIMALVCPKSLRPDFTIMFDKNWQSKPAIDTKEILNKISVISGEIDKKYKIIATYDTAANNADDYLCYTDPQNIENIYREIESDIQEDNYLITIVDDYTNVDKVINKFNDLNFIYIVMQNTSNELLSRVVQVGSTITILVLIISIFIMYFNNCKLINARKKELYLYRILGYNFKQIKSILILENMIVCFLSWVFAIILAFGILKGFQLYLLNSIVGNSRIVVYIDYLSLFLSLFLSIIIPFITVLFSFKKNTQNLMMEMKREN